VQKDAQGLPRLTHKKPAALKIKQDIQNKQLSSNRFTRYNRLLNKCDYEPVFKSAKKSKDRIFLVLFCENKKNRARLGLAISKKNCSLAKDRNKIKRTIRESFRKNIIKLNGYDVVVLNNKLTHTAASNDLRKSLNMHWDKIQKGP